MTNAVPPDRGWKALHIPPVVLLVDDEEDQRELYAQYLRFVGYRVEMAQSGFEAVEVALSSKPDIIVMDLSMPVLDGFETTRRLKALQNTRAIPVVALTAYGELPEERALSAGCAAYLLKPCPPRDLEITIDGVLQRARTAH